MSAHARETVERDATAPRRIALFSDVHGNLPALEAVLADIEMHEVEERWCLGDLVGYGAQPNECVARVAEVGDRCLTGNHDLVVLGKLDVDEFSRNAAAAAMWTRETVTSETTDFLAACEPTAVIGEVGLFHASPRDPVWEYVLSALLASDCMDVMETRIGALGHSHVPLHFGREDGERAHGEVAPGGTELDISSGEWLLNPGAVGQPRDGDPRAAWLLLETEPWKASWRRVEYPIEQAAAAIETAGLPGMLAERLYYGQ